MTAAIARDSPVIVSMLPSRLSPILQLMICAPALYHRPSLAGRVVKHGGVVMQDARLWAFQHEQHCSQQDSNRRIQGKS